jgi:hypothetical protein
MGIITTYSEGIKQAKAILETLFESDDVIEFRCISETTRRINSEWYTLEKVDFTYLTQANRLRYHVYFGVNPRTKEGGRTAEDVELCRSLCVDLDDHSPHELIARTDAALLARPHVCISSGGGSQAFWRLREPITPGEWLKKQAGIIDAVKGADRTIKDLPRVMRLPGFVNWKDKYAPTNPVATIYHPENCHE